MWKEDSKVCERFAHERNKARELLAHDPEDNLKSREERRAELEQRRMNFDANMRETMRVWKEDRHACLRGEGWTDDSISELETKDRKARDSKS